MLESRGFEINEQTEKEARQRLEMMEDYRRQEADDAEYWASLSREKREWSEAAKREHDERLRQHRQEVELGTDDGEVRYDTGVMDGPPRDGVLDLGRR